MILCAPCTGVKKCMKGADMKIVGEMPVKLHRAGEGPRKITDSDQGGLKTKIFIFKMSSDIKIRHFSLKKFIPKWPHVAKSI